jgi:hypothetical protein
MSRFLGAVALGVAPFAGFYLYTKMYSLITRTLRFNIYRLLPRPYNANRRRPLRETTPVQLGADIPVELRTDEIIDSTTPIDTPWHPGSAIPRRQSTISLRGSSNPDQPATATAAAVAHDDFASDDEESELVSATLISFDVEATEPIPDSPIHFDGSDPTSSSSPNNNSSNNNNNNTPGLWSAELRPNVPSSDNGGNRPAMSSGSGYEPVYRETVLTRLPAVLATDVLAITPARLLMTPLAAMVWLRLARPYMARQGMDLDLVHGLGLGGLFSWTGVVNLLGLELVLAVMHGEAWAAVMLAAERWRVGEEEWCEREGVAGGEGEGEGVEN